MNYFRYWSPPPVKYKGLKNQGATCYLNSVLQVLFMTDDFRDAVERYPGDECIDLQLKRLFGELRDQTTDTFGITNRLDIRQMYEQQDAAEYYEKILKLTSNEASQIFHGELTHRTTCSECGTHTGRDGRFWHLPLTLVDSSGEYNVVTGIEEYFKASTFSGDNQMYCEQCDDKRDATMQCVIKHHPEVLMLLLKRFELDYRYMTYYKINATVLIPHTLKIPENQTYELYAVVDHSGDLRSGHYSACIRSQEDDRWFRFDDARVTEMDQPFQSGSSESSPSAYLLFYRKKSAPAADTESPEDIREESTPGGSVPSTSHDEEPQEGVMVNGEVKVEETAEPEIDIKVVEKDRVSVSSEEERKLPETDLENRDHPMQGNHEENNENNDSYLQLQDKEDEEKTASDNEEVFRRREGAEKRKVISKESLSEENDESKTQKVKTMRQERPKEVCEDKENFMEDKRDEDKDEKSGKIGTGRKQDNERKEVEQEVRQEGGEDTKQGSERKPEGAEVKSGADKVESRDSQPLRNPVEKTRDHVRVRKGTQNMPKDAETQVKRGHSDCTQDRTKSSHSQVAPVRSRSLTEGKQEVRKRDKQTESDEGIMEEKQRSKESGTCKEEEKKGTQSGIRKRPELEEITLETTSSRKRKRKNSVEKNLSWLFCGLSLFSKAKKVKIEPETQEQDDVVTQERKKRQSRWFSAKKRSKEKQKSSKEEKKLIEEKQKSSKEEKKLIEEKQKISKEEKKRSKEKQKSSKEEKKLIEEKQKSSKEEKKLIEEKQKSSKEEKKLIEEKQKSSKEEKKRSKEKQKSSKEEKKLIEEKQKSSKEEKKRSKEKKKRSKEKNKTG